MTTTEANYRPAQTIDGPWLQNKRWATGRISDNSWAGLIVAWLLVIFWNAVSWPLLVTLMQEELQRQGSVKPAAWVGLIFPLIGLVGFVGVVYLTVRQFKFGRSWLELETLPGCVGGWFAGTIHTAVRLDHAEHVRVALRCVRRITRGAGKQRRTTESTLWEEEQTLAGRLPSSRQGGSVIPVSFRIPPHCPATFDDARDDIIWRVRARAAMMGTDYASNFIVPVFAVDQPAHFTPQAEPIAARLRTARGERGAIAVQDPDVDIATDAAGRKRFVFPARRNRKTAIVLAGFALAFTAGCALILARLPIFLLFVFGPMSLAAWWGAVLFGFRHVELRVDRHGIERRWRVLLFSGQRHLDAAEISRIRKKVTMESNGKSHYSVFAVLQGKEKQVFLVSGLANSDAQHVVEEIRRALGADDRSTDGDQPPPSRAAEH